MLRPGNPVRQHGQPRPEVEDAPRLPTAAERARTLVEGNSSAVLDIPGLQGVEPHLAAHLMTPEQRLVDADGDVLLRLPSGSPAVRAAARARGAELVAVLEITDVAPVAVAHRIRGRAWVAGWLTAARDRRPGLLRLEVGEVTVDDLWGAEQVEPAEFAAATADPLASREAELLQHLAAAHRDRLDLLTRLVARCPGRPDGLGDAGTAVPVALDRFGLRVRLRAGGTLCDARFDFPAPVRGIGELRRALHELFAAAGPRG